MNITYNSLFFETSNRINIKKSFWFKDESSIKSIKYVEEKIKMESLLDKKTKTFGFRISRYYYFDGQTLFYKEVKLIL